MKKNWIQNLKKIFSKDTTFALAVSGGLDSVTLARLFDLSFGKNNFIVYHGISSAVPSKLTKNLQSTATKHDWNYEEFNLNEIGIDDYKKNPINRCFYCKKNLYSLISRITSSQIISGTNLDDLKEFRPGLKAAGEFRVRHPFVELGLKKEMVRELAKELKLSFYAKLHSSPCLSSRIQTGIEITPDLHKMIDSVETLIRKTERTALDNIRCRVTSEGINLEVDKEIISKVTHNKKLEMEIIQIISKFGYKSKVSYKPYVNGSAFRGGY
jgi:uncharacterized protein